MQILPFSVMQRGPGHAGGHVAPAAHGHAAVLGEHLAFPRGVGVALPVLTSTVRTSCLLAAVGVQLLVGEVDDDCWR
jgi:hypothetical protein